MWAAQWRSQTFAMGRARPPEGPLTSWGPPPNFYILLGFRPLHFENMENRFFCKILQEKNAKFPAEGPLITKGAPQFPFSPRISATLFCKHDKTSLFVKFCRKNVKMSALWVPRHAMGGGGTCPLCPPMLRHRGSFAEIAVRKHLGNGAVDFPRK